MAVLLEHPKTEVSASKAISELSATAFPLSFPPSLPLSLDRSLAPSLSHTPPSFDDITLQVTLYAMKCFACLFACADATRTSEDELLSRSYFDVLFGKSPGISACLFKFLALAAKTTTEGDSAPGSEFASEAPALKVKCLSIIRFLCDKYPAELEVVLRDAPGTLVQCLGAADAAVLDEALPLMLTLCGGSTEYTVLLREACGQALINSLVSNQVLRLFRKIENYWLGTRTIWIRFIGEHLRQSGRRRRAQRFAYHHSDQYNTQVVVQQLNSGKRSDRLPSVHPGADEVDRTSTFGTYVREAALLYLSRLC